MTSIFSQHNPYVTGGNFNDESFKHNSMEFAKV